MAKQARDGGSIESGFDFSKFLDLDDDSALDPTSGSEEDGYQTIPHSREEIATGALDSDLEGEVESYIKAGKVSWGDKRNLRKLAAENSALESTIRDADAAILERADSYHALVSSILQEKNSLEGFALDDSDPYDTQIVGTDAKPQTSRASRDQSSELFNEIERLERHRNGLNETRTSILTEIRDAASRQENGGWEPLEEVIGEKLAAIDRVQGITRVKFSEEDEAVFDQGVDELTDYIHGNFDPLAEEDEYDEDEQAPRAVAEIPLSSDGHSPEEMIAMEEASESSSSDQSFGAFFGSDNSYDEHEGYTDEPEASTDADSEPAGEEFSSEETVEELTEALGEGYAEVHPEDESDEEFSEEIELSVETPSAESLESAPEDFAHSDFSELPEDSSSEETAAEVELRDDEESTDGELEALDGVLSADELQTDEHSAEDENIAQTGSWHAEGGPVSPYGDETVEDDTAPDEIAAAELSKLEADEPEDEFAAEESSEAAQEEPRHFELEDTVPWSTVQELAEPSAPSDSYASWTENDEPVYADFSEYADSASGPVRTLIFDELKVKHGISFEGVAGLED